MEMGSVIAICVTVVFVVYMFCDLIKYCVGRKHRLDAHMENKRLEELGMMRPQTPEVISEPYEEFYARRNFRRG